MTATIEGRTYEIPELWVAGFCRDGRSPMDAVAFWHEQSVLNETATQQKAKGETAAAHVDAILATPLRNIPRVGKPGYGAARSKAIRDTFRALGWSKFLRVTKGGYSLGSSIEWADGMRPEWNCPRVAELMRRRGQGSWFDIGYCTCATCETRRAQRDAISRRVHYVLNVAFANEGREFGDRSDSQSDYFDADYTFHA